MSNVAPAPSRGWTPATLGGGVPEGVLTFDIETSVDRALLPDDWDATRFPKPAWHRVEAISMVESRIARGDGGGEILEVEAVRSGGRIGWSERKLLAGWWAHLGARPWRLASFNGARFDLAVLLARTFVHGLDASVLWRRGTRYAHYLSRYDQTWHVDLMQALSLNGAAPAHRLEELALATGWPGKLGESGGLVEQMIERGEHDRVRRYCETDAAQTHGLLLSWMRVTGSMDADGYDLSLASLMRVLEADPESRPHLAALARHRRAWTPPGADAPSEIRCGVAVVEPPADGTEARA